MVLRRLTVAAAAVGLLGAGATVAFHDTKSTPAPARAEAAQQSPRVLTVRPDRSTITARTVRLGASPRRVPLLWIREVGRLIVRCATGGGTEASLIAAKLLPTADVLVERGEGEPVAATVAPRKDVRVASTGGKGELQTWRIAPFAKAGVRVTTIWLAMGLVPASSAHDCFASAQALTTEVADRIEVSTP